MSFGPAGYDRNDSGCAEFRALFNCPFHTVKFENGKSERQIGSGGLNYFVTPVEFNPIVVYHRHAAAAGTPPPGFFLIFCRPAPKETSQTFIASTHSHGARASK